jgi:PAS domain S-box-containing protein
MLVLCQHLHVPVRLVQKGPLDGRPSSASLPPSAQVFADLVEGIPQVLGCMKDPAGRYVWSNTGFANRLGIRPDEVVGRTVDELFPVEFARSYAGQDAQVLATGRPLQSHLELIVRADGGIGWYVTSKSRLIGIDRSVWGLAVLSIDLQSQLESAHAGLARMISRVREQVGHPWRVPELATIAGLSPKQLERLASRTLGLSPQRLVQRLRLEHAVRLITETVDSLGAISAECGFYDQSSFTKQFRSVLGLTPGAYRRAPT